MGFIMSSLDTENAFRIIEKEIKDNIRDTRKELSVGAINNSSLNELNKLTEKLKQYEQLLKQVNSIKTVFDSLAKKKDPISKEYISDGRANKGERVPQVEFRLPILKVLKQMGGSGRTKDVIDNIYPLMKNNFTKKDLENVPSRNEPRWRNEAMWERNSMVQDGLLSHNSPHGIWEITPEGIKYLNKYEK